MIGVERAQDRLAPTSSLHYLGSIERRSTGTSLQGSFVCPVAFSIIQIVTTRLSFARLWQLQ